MPNKHLEDLKRGERKTGRRYKSGAYSIEIQDKILKENPRVQRYLLDCRTGLVKDVAGGEKDLTEQQRIMIDRIISRLAVCRIIELYVERYGAFRRDRVEKDKVLELEPCLGVNYLAFSNSIDRALTALGLDRRKSIAPLDLGRYIEAKDKAKPAPSGSQERGGGAREADDAEAEGDPS